jgi:hypothetical protein
VEDAVIKALLSGALLFAVAAGAAFYALRDSPPQPVAPLAPPRAPQIDAASIGSGRLAMERLPPEVGQALEAHSEEIVRNAEAIAGKQSRITGTCAPGSAIRVIAEDGTVRCQQLARGVVSVPAIAGVPRLSTTVTEAVGVPGGAGRYQTGGEDDFIVVPVPLPDGALVTGLTYVFLDDDKEVDTTAYLYRSDDQPLAAVSSSGASPQVRVLSSDRVDLHKVDASRYAYFVYFQTSTKSGAGIVPISASVAYRLP